MELKNKIKKEQADLEEKVCWGALGTLTKHMVKPKEKEDSQMFDSFYIFD